MGRGSPVLVYGLEIAPPSGSQFKFIRFRTNFLSEKSGIGTLRGEMRAFARSRCERGVAC